MSIIRRKKTVAEPKETPPERPSVIELPPEDVKTQPIVLGPLAVCVVCGTDRANLAPAEPCPVDGYRPEAE